MSQPNDKSVEVTPSLSANWSEFFADKLGICLSGLCLVHCLITPIILLLLPSMHVLWEEKFHFYMALVIPVLALAAFVPGYFKHRQKSVFVYGALGVALICLSAFYHGEFAEHFMHIGPSILGSLLLIRAHWLNRKLCTCHCHGEKH